MSELEDEDLEFVEKVIEENKEGLVRLAKEEDAAEKRASRTRKRLRKFLRKIRKLRGEEEDGESASFSRIED
ncbi:MAG: hypothetical protein ABEJ36_06325 [Candidatus Nanosalina sp.]